jgi:uncharacterized protein (TIGR00369 family)
MTALEDITQQSAGTLAEALGIEITGVDGRNVLGRMPVDKRTVQIHGVLHGGASVAFAETLASIGANLLVDYPRKYCVGVEINANHVTSVKSGWVEGIASPLKIGARIQVWDIRITGSRHELVCVSRLTLAVIDKKDR